MNYQLTKSNFERQVLLNEKLVLVKFKNDWNGACQIMAPVYKELSELYTSNCIFIG
jgi:thiol-disulfide isomerase/thioredoxin